MSKCTQVARHLHQKAPLGVTALSTQCVHPQRLEDRYLKTLRLQGITWMSAAHGVLWGAVGHGSLADQPGEPSWGREGLK